MLKELKNYPGYFINESGVIIDSNCSLIKSMINRDGRLYVTLNSNIEFVDELVAMTFLINDENYSYIRHCDSDSLNCHLSNIRWSNKKDTSKIPYRDHKKYSNSKNIYEVYNKDTGDVVSCIGRGEVAQLIQYEEISLKNMIGNGRIISVGPYKGYQIRRIKEAK